MVLIRLEFDIYSLQISELVHLHFGERWLIPRQTIPRELTHKRQSAQLTQHICIPFYFTVRISCVIFTGHLPFHMLIDMQ